MNTKQALFFAGFFLALNVDAKSANICEKLIAQAEAICEKAMCDDQFRDEDESRSECIRDGDFYEGKGVCVYDGELPALIEKYNQKHAKNRIGCDSDGSVVDAPALANFTCEAKTGGEFRFIGSILEESLSVTIHDTKDELLIKEFKSPDADVEFSKSLRKKESTYGFAKFYSDYNAWQGLELSIPKDVVSGERKGKFPAYFTVYGDNGNFMAPGDSISLSCRIHSY